MDAVLATAPGWLAGLAPIVGSLVAGFVAYWRYRDRREHRAYLKEACVVCRQRLEDAEPPAVVGPLVVALFAAAGLSWAIASGVPTRMVRLVQPEQPQELEVRKAAPIRRACSECPRCPCREGTCECPAETERRQRRGDRPAAPIMADVMLPPGTDSGIQAFADPWPRLASGLFVEPRR